MLRLLPCLFLSVGFIHHMIGWRLTWLLSLIFWASFAHSNPLPNLTQTVVQTLTDSSPVLSIYVTSSYTLPPQTKIQRLKSKHSPQTIHYLWLKSKKTALTRLSCNLNNGLPFDNSGSIPPFYTINRELISYLPIQLAFGNRPRLVFQTYWMRDTSSKNNRLKSWKESNLQYKGSLTYYA